MKQRSNFQKLIMVMIILVLGLFCFSAASGEEIAIDEANFPDPIFRKFVKDCLDPDGNGSLTREEADSVIVIAVSKMEIGSVEGIEHFTSLKELNCWGNELTALDVSRNSALKVLDCSYNQLTALDVSRNTALEDLDCSVNQLTALDVSRNTALKKLTCSENQLTALDVSKNTALMYLYCLGNQLSSLDVRMNIELVDLLCYENQLSSLDVSRNTALEHLSCDYNQLTNLDVSKNTALSCLSCIHNQLSELDVSHCPVLVDLISQNDPGLDGDYSVVTWFIDWEDDGLVDITLMVDSNVLIPGYTEDTVAINATNFPDAIFREYVKQFDRNGSGGLNCTEIVAVGQIDPYNRGVESLKGIEYFTHITHLYCSGNSLTQLDLSKNTALEVLECNYNQLTQLDVSKNTNLVSLTCSANQLSNLDISQNTKLEDLTCNENQLTALDVSHNINLITLWFSDNQLTSIDLSKNTKLENLFFENNKIISIDISSLQKLKCMNCYNNPLETLDVSKCPVLANLVKGKEPTDNIFGLYGWGNSDPDIWPENFLFISPNISVVAKVLEPAEKVEAYVIRCYSVILGREPDPSGLETWFNELNSGRKTASEIIDRFVNSPEFLGKNYNNEEAVDILYQTMLGRNADAGGKANWVKKLENGQTLAHVINGFCFSKEFRDLCDSYGIKAGFVNIPNTDTTAEGKIKAFVQRCYRIILDREADPSGMQTWYEQLSSGKKAAAEIIDRFVNSPEFSGKNYSHSDSVEILYKAMLGRGSDAAGKANWVGKLDAGQPFAVVINGFCVSKEFTGICASYGIKPGSVNVQLSGMAEEEALSMLAYKAKAPITKKSETNPTRVEIINPSDTIDMNIGTAVQAVYINEEKAKEFISRCYQCILGREASAAELNNWIGQMTNGTKTPDQIARGFLFSNEFKGRNVGNEDLVKILYKVYMNRDADPEGLATWTEKLDNGTSLNDLLNTFSKTGEFKKVVSEMSK